jgi:hypothetical protein
MLVLHLAYDFRRDFNGGLVNKGIEGFLQLPLGDNFSDSVSDLG